MQVPMPTHSIAHVSKWLSIKKSQSAKNFQTIFRKKFILKCVTDGQYCTDTVEGHLAWAISQCWHAGDADRTATTVQIYIAHVAHLWLSLTYRAASEAVMVKSTNTQRAVYPLATETYESLAE